MQGRDSELTTRDIGHGTVRLLQGDITRISADAIVNAANSGLQGGGGVDGAIHQAGGPSIMEECRRIGGCPTGSAVITGAGNLNAQYVIHAAAPVWRGGTYGEAEQLASAYAAALRLASELGLESVAFPSLGTGAYGFPLREAAEIALRVVAEHLQAREVPGLVLFVLYGESAFAAFDQTLALL